MSTLVWVHNEVVGNVRGVGYTGHGAAGLHAIAGGGWVEGPPSSSTQEHGGDYAKAYAPMIGSWLIENTVNDSRDFFAAFAVTPGATVLAHVWILFEEDDV